MTGEPVQLRPDTTATPDAEHKQSLDAILDDTIHLSDPNSSIPFGSSLHEQSSPQRRPSSPNSIDVNSNPTSRFPCGSSVLTGSATTLHTLEQGQLSGAQVPVVSTISHTATNSPRSQVFTISEVSFERSAEDTSYGDVFHEETHTSTQTPNLQNEPNIAALPVDAQVITPLPT
jgi:hypothetical protein